MKSKQNTKWKKKLNDIEYLHHFSRCKCFRNSRFHKIEDGCINRRPIVVSNISQWKEDGIKWEFVAISCPLINESQINLMSSSIVQQKYLLKIVLNIVHASHIRILITKTKINETLIDSIIHTRISWLFVGAKTLAR